MNDEIGLTTVNTDTGSFTIGMTVRFTRWRNQIVRERWYHRFALHRVQRRLTWWRCPPAVVIDIDRKNGSITLASMRWSWRRWKWVRA